MQRYAIFVDAGYLFAAGANALTGNRLAALPYRTRPRRRRYQAQLKSTADGKVDGASLLRIYWYDGLLPVGITRQQQILAEADDVKLRLGVVNAFRATEGR